MMTPFFQLFQLFRSQTLVLLLIALLQTYSESNSSTDPMVPTLKYIQDTTFVIVSSLNYLCLKYLAEWFFWCKRQIMLLLYPKLSKSPSTLRVHTDLMTVISRSYAIWTPCSQVPCLVLSPLLSHTCLTVDSKVDHVTCSHTFLMLCLLCLLLYF